MFGGFLNFHLFVCFFAMDPNLVHTGAWCGLVTCCLIAYCLARVALRLIPRRCRSGSPDEPAMEVSEFWYLISLSERQKPIGGVSIGWFTQYVLAMAALVPASGLDILLAHVENDDPQLWQMNPSGEFSRCDVKAIGFGSERAEQNLVVSLHWLPAPRTGS